MSEKSKGVLMLSGLNLTPARIRQIEKKWKEQYKGYRLVLSPGWEVELCQYREQEKLKTSS